jgi:hypothetical protein
MEELTTQQSLENLRAALNTFVGTKQQHIILDKSFEKIVDALTPKKPKE